MQEFGPLYCETGHALLYMAEPINTLTNFAIIGAAAAAFVFIRRSGIRPAYDLYLLATMLFATGFGSLWWHGTRERIALAFDVFPGVIFLLCFAYLWLRHLYGILAGIAGVTGLVVAVWVAGRISDAYDLPFLFPIFGGVLATGIVFVALTYRKGGKELALSGSLILLVSLAAAFFRTIDLSVCAVIPFGTHFIWHILLSAAAYLGITFIARLRQEK